MANYNLNSFRNTYILTDQTGSLFDSGGPTGSYSTGENYYILIAPNNATGSLTLNVISGNIDVNDALRIYNGIPNTSSYSGLTLDGTLIAVLSGSLSAQTITASSGRAYIRFGSKSSTNTVGTLAGFQLDWTGSGIQTVDSSSGVIRNQYAATFPQESYLTFAPGMLTGSSTLTGSKDIVLGFWARFDYDSTDPLRGLITIGDAGSGNQGLVVNKVSTTNDLRIVYRDSNGNANLFTATNMLQGGGTGAPSAAKLVPQWHHYGWAIRRTSTTGYNVAAYRDGAFFASSSATFASVHGNITSSLTTVVGQYRSAGVISTGQSWTGSFDDIFLGTVDSVPPVSHSSFFSSIYNSGNWSDPTQLITGSYYSGKNGAVIFNWRFEETGSMLNTKDWGSFGNIHTASTMVTGGGNVFLTATASGQSYTAYSSLAYSASVKSNAVVSFNTGSAAVYENTSSYIFNLQVTTASVGQSATASISFGGSDTAILGTNYTITANGVSYTTGSQLPIYLSWSAGDTTTKYITASIIDNTTYTGTSSSFTARILTGSSTNITLGTNSSFTLNILDYEEGNPSLTSASYSTGEASGSVLIYVDRLSGSQGPLSVNYSTVNGTAVSGTNYTRTTGTFSWADGNSSRLSASIPILFDGIQTSSKNFSVSLFNLSTGSFLPYAVTSSTITIADQEQGTFNWSATTLTAYETGTLATINVNRISGTYGPVTLNISGSSSLGQPLRTTMTGTLSFADGDTSKQFTINIQDDLIDSSNDIIYYRLYPTASVTGAFVFTGSSGLLAFTLIDNETGSVTFNTGAASVYENTSSYIFNIQRLYGGDQAQTASISYTSTATQNVDYNVIYNGITRTSPFNITWEDQDKSTKYVTASIYDNQTSGSTKTVSFSIASSSISSIGPSSSFVLSILDYEEGYPTFTSSSYSTGEASSSITIYVDRLSGSQGPLSINYSTVNGTAVSGTNYTKTTGTLSWTDTDTSRKNFSVPILYDNVQTSNLNFTVNLSNLSTGSYSSYPTAITSSTVTIIDQEPGKFRFVSSSYTVTEGASVTVGVERYSGSFGTVTMKITSSNGTAVSGTDYTNVNQALTFSNNETSKTFSVSTIDNAIDVTGSLYFSLGFNNISSAYGTSSAGTPLTSTIYITDNESGSIRFVTASYTGSQNSSIIISVERYSGGDFAATASIYVSSSSTSVAGVDYLNNFPYTVNWADQESGSKNVTITTLGSWNADSRLNVYLGNLTNISSGSIMSSSILIKSNVLTQSVSQYQNYSKDYVIYDYANLSNQFTRRAQQVPFALNKKGTGLIRKP